MSEMTGALLAGSGPSLWLLADDLGSTGRNHKLYYLHPITARQSAIFHKWSDISSPVQWRWSCRWYKRKRFPAGNLSLSCPLLARIESNHRI
ncbi:hypothetical protein [Sulfitobacter brevis]|uniref:hypothetical protein n=1 Tax=Sulfitobacter brevis TaxID=74348 RepID=UPI0011600CAE|nr:hypothetical protein [Sulfitobacter brevis]